MLELSRSAAFETKVSGDSGKVGPVIAPPTSACMEDREREEHPRFRYQGIPDAGESMTRIANGRTCEHTVLAHRNSSARLNLPLVIEENESCGMCSTERKG